MKKMEKSKDLLNVLCLEDELKDAELLNEMLVDAGYLVNMDIAAGEKEYLSFLKGRNYDIILADYKLPRFDVHTALKLALELQPEVPFICVSGTIDEDTAVELLKQGATDYIFKDRLGRLAFAVRKALEGAANQKEGKKAEKTLRESEEKYRVLFEGSALGILATDVETHRLLYSNPASCRLFGYLDDEFLRLTITDLHPKDSMDLVMSEFESLMRGEKVISSALPCLRKDGTVFYADISNNSTIINGRKCAVGFIVDVTTRKQTEEALKQANSELQNLHNNLDLAVFSVDVIHNKMLQVSIAHEAVFGYCQEAFFNNPMLWYEIIVPEDKPNVDAGYPVLFSGMNLHHEYRIVHADGQIRWIEAKMKPTLDTNGKLIRIDGIASNITERKRLEETLLESEVKYQEIFESTGTATFIGGENTIILMANKECYSITGYTPTEIIGQKWDQYFAPESLQEIMKNHHLRRQNPDLAPKKHEVKLFNKQGEKRDVILNISMISGTKQSIVSILDITERKQAEEMLLESEVKYHEIFESTGTATFISDENATILMANNECCSIMGHTATEIIGQNWNQYFAPESLPEIMKNHQLRSQNPDLAQKKYEAKLINKKGEKRDVILNVSMISATKQRIVSMSDITELKRTEQAILQSEKNFYSSISESPLGIRIVSVDGKTIYANKVFLDIYEFNSLEEFTNTSAINRYTPKSYAQHQERKEKRKNGHDIFDYEISIVCKNAEIRHIKVSRKEVLWNGSKHIQVINLNITEQRKAEEELRKLSRAVEQSPNAECITDTEGIIEYVNPITIELTGYTQEELLGQKSSIFSSGEKPKEEYAELWQTIKSGNVWKGELHNKKKNGELYWEYATISPIFDDLGSITHYLGIKEDITAKKQLLDELIAAKEKAEESERLKSAFLANMSHEIRTPMNGILGFAGLLKEPNLSGDEMQEYIEIIEKSGVRMLNIIDQIVDISKIEAGLMEVHIGDTNINEQIEYIYKFFKAEVESKGMKLTYSVSFPEKELIISTDKEKIYAILINLVKNAIKYSFDGSIEFGYSNLVINNRTFLQFFVKDTGIGIPKERQEAVFERFIQADIGDKRAYQGAGLGLSISKAYVKMLGGKIWVESTEGHGSVFYFTIPYQVELVEDIVAKNTIFADEMLPQIKRIKILVVEDIEEASLLIKILINKFCKEVLCARDGFEAVEICRNNPDIDLVLMDIKMPVMNGYEATREIRQFNPSVVIIAQTAFGLSGDREKAIEAGCNDYITKPINRNELQTLIQKHFK